jgi:FkbM family methyltransferase
MSAADSAKKLLRKAGVEVSRSPAPNTFGWQLRQVTRLRQVDGVVDVGGHHGEFASMMRDEVGYRGPIVSFEPSSESFAVMCQRLAGDQAWSGQHMALGAESGTLELNVFSSTDFNSFRQPNDLGQQRFGARSDHVESVAVNRLDQVLELPGQLLLKSDTQGFDLEVLRGASGLLDRVVAITVELPVRNIYADSPSLTDLVSYLVELGFELVGMFPLSRDRDRLRVIEFDGVFLRS